MKILKGKVHKYGADVNTDAIIPARYLSLSEPAELARHCMEDIDKEFLNRIKPGDIMVATTNFGCGSSREHAPLAIKAAGISCIIAKSFARIFFRNAINVGLPVLVCDTDKIQEGDMLEVDLAGGTIADMTNGQRLTFGQIPPVMLKILDEGGLLPYIKKFGGFVLPKGNTK